MTEIKHNHYMQQVISLACTVSTQTRPNPRVACIIVKDNQIIGTGIHLFKGQPHAEIYALQQAAENAQGATLYVNLEPCSHYGATPPCADAIIQSNIKQVIIANLDPNPLVAGKGIKKLQDAGINVITGILHQEAYAINSIFFHNITQNIPYVMLKVGMSIDGRIATKNNISKWITNSISRQDAHNYRAQYDGILIGVDSVISDNPSLTPYLATEQNNIMPIRIILDSNLRTPLNAQLITDAKAPTWIITCNTDKILQQHYQQYTHVKIINVINMDLDEILHLLYKNGIYSLMVEGGEKIYSSFIQHRYVNQIITYISPQIIGSKLAKHFVAGDGFSDLTNNLKLQPIEIKQLGNDIKIVYEVIG